MKVNPIIESLGTYPLEIVQHRARDRRDAGLPLVDFSIGDPREPTPAFIPQALMDNVPEISQYPTAKGLAVIREAVAAYLGRRFSVMVDPETQVIPTSGSKEAIFLTPLAFVDRDRGDSVIYGTPGYPVYERGAMFAGAQLDSVVLSGDFVLRASDVKDEAWERAALAWICSPHNPAGSITSRSDMEELLKHARDSATWLCSDECYVDLYDSEAPGSILQVAGEGFKGALSYLSLSKRSGMTGYRSGAIVGDADAIAAIRALRSTVGVAPAEYVQHAGAAAWSDDDHATERRQIFKNKRQVLRKAFDDMGYPVVASDAGLYLWVKVEDDEDVTLRLLEHGIVVAPGRAFGSGGEGYIRLALVPTLEECEESAEMIERYSVTDQQAEDRQLIEAVAEDPTKVADATDAILRTIEELDKGRLRVAEKVKGEWIVNTWVKQAILGYFRIAESDTMEAGPFEYFDKIPTKTDLKSQGVRVVPPGTVRYGAYCEPGVIVMPGYVNIGAYVGSGSMVDTWATVGSCAQIGKGVHLSGGVGIGGVLEPAGARPVIVEDGAFIGSRCILVEGVMIEEGAVLGANTTITASTPIIDVTGSEPVEMRGRVPANSVVLPGTRPKTFPAGTFDLQCALIVGKRTESTDRKTSLNDALREFEVSV